MLTRRELGLLFASAMLDGCRRRGSTPGAPRAVDEVHVDVSQSIGAFARLSGVQGSPAPLVEGEVERVREARELGIEHARIDQDCPPNTLTLSGTFPDEAANPDAPGSYRFEAVDRHIRAARDAGAKVMWQSSYDVGGTDVWKGLNLGGRAPENVERWSRVVTRCLEHFNNGWANGMDSAVDAVEFVNEPDGLGGFEREHAPRLLPTFLAFLDTVERYNREHPTTTVRAVGPGIPLSMAEWPEWQPRFDKALDAIARTGKKLPVWSFHTYGRDVSPRANAELARATRAMLDRHGFRDTELWNTEWLAGDFLSHHLAVDREHAERYGEDDQRRYAAGMAAYAVACKLRWQGIVNRSYFYRLNQRAFPPGKAPPFAGKGFGRFFMADGRLGALALQEKLLARVALRTPERCATRYDEGGTTTALGTRARDGSAAALVVSSLDTKPRPLALRVRGWPPERRARARALLLDARSELSEIELSTPSLREGALSLELELLPLSIAWVVIEST